MSKWEEMNEGQTYASDSDVDSEKEGSNDEDVEGDVDLDEDNISVTGLGIEEDEEGGEDEDEDKDDEGGEDECIGEEDEGELASAKFHPDFRSDFIVSEHPEVFSVNFTEIDELCDAPNKKTLPFLTKFEVAKIVGQRAKQINAGAKVLLSKEQRIEEEEQELMDGYLLAQLELRAKTIPFIIKRPLFGGVFEYWRVSDLELLD